MKKRVETGQRKTDKRGDRIKDGHLVNDAVSMCSVAVKAAVGRGVKVTATKNPACLVHNLPYKRPFPTHPEDGLRTRPCHYTTYADFVRDTTEISV